MRKILLSTTNHEENRIAVVDNGRLTDYLSVIAGQEDRRGSILCGIISEIEPSLEACFVDIGDDKKGFLQFSDIHEDCLLDKEGPMAERLAKGQPILVQVTKDSRSKKGPLLSTRIKMKSNHLVLMTREKEPDGLRVSRKGSDSERERIVNAAGQLDVDRRMTMIVRSNGLDKSIDSLEWEKNSMLSLWKLIQQVFAKQESPTLIYEYRNIINICLSEYMTKDTDEIICDEADTEQEIKGLLTSMGNSMADHVRIVKEDEALFEEPVLKQVDALLSRKVSLPSGGEIVIDITEALVAIDVNSSRSRSQKGIEDTALSTNMEAATEVAVQLKLRNLSGLIVVDFIDMDNHANRDKLENHFRRALRVDQAQTSVGNLSQYGLIEMTRQYVGRPLHESHTVVCEHCDGTGRIPTVRAFSISILDKVQDLCINRKQVKTIIVELPIAPATFILNEKRGDLNRFMEDFDVDVIILPSHALRGNESKFRVEKTARTTANRKMSFESITATTPSQESYIDEKQSRRLQAPAAISGVVQHQEPTHTVKTAQRAGGGQQGPGMVDPGKPGFSFSRLIRSFVSGPKAEPEVAEPVQVPAPTSAKGQGQRSRTRRSGDEQGARKRKPKSRSRSRKKPAEAQGQDGAEAQKQPADARQENAGGRPAKKRRSGSRKKARPESDVAKGNGEIVSAATAEEKAAEDKERKDGDEAPLSHQAGKQVVAESPASAPEAAGNDVDLATKTPREEKPREPTPEKPALVAESAQPMEQPVEAKDNNDTAAFEPQQQHPSVAKEHVETAKEPEREPEPLAEAAPPPSSANPRDRGNSVRKA